MDATFWITGRAISHRLLTATSLRQYRRIGLNRAATKYLQVPGIRPLNLLTDDIFVPLKIESNIESRERDGESLILSNLSSGYFFYRTLTEHDEPHRPSKPRQVHNRFVVIGDPGSGKSSYIKYLFRLLCRMPTFLGPPLPIMVELKELIPPENIADEDRVLGRWVYEYLRELVVRTDGFEMGSLFDTYVRGRGLYVMFDGLDETSAAQYPEIVNGICGVSKRLGDLSPNTSIILTMRSQFHSQVSSDFSDEYPTVLRMQPFTPADIYEFLAQWPFPKSASENAARIFAELTDRPTLREMCSNPLVLAMYVGNDQLSQDHSASDTRTAFYSRVVEELLVARRARQLKTQARTVLREQREAILGRLAYDNLTDLSAPANSIPWNQAVRVTKKVMKCKDLQTAEIRLREISKDTGIISEERPSETLRFIHLTFCEFLAAKEAVDGRKGGWEELLKFHRANSVADSQNRSRLVEVLPFAAALLPRSVRASGIASISALNDRPVLARTFLETKEYSDPAWQQWVTDTSVSLITTDPSNWNDEWLSQLHLLSVLVQDEEAWAATYGEPAAFSLDTLFFQLVQSDRQRLSRVFATYAALDPSASFRLAAAIGVDLLVDQPELVIDSLSSPAFFAIAVSHFSEKRELTEKWARVFADAGLRSRLVAHRLSDTQPSANLRRVAASAPGSYRWHTSRKSIFAQMLPTGGWKQSAYAFCLTISINGHADSEVSSTPSRKPAAKALRNARPARFCLETRIPIILADSCVASAVIVFILGEGSVVESIRDSSATWWYPSAVALILGLVMGALCRVMRWRYRIYEAVLNIDDSSIGQARESALKWRFSFALRLALLTANGARSVGSRWLRRGLIPPFAEISTAANGLQSRIISTRYFNRLSLADDDIDILAEVEFKEAPLFGRRKMNVTQFPRHTHDVDSAAFSDYARFVGRDGND